MKCADCKRELEVGDRYIKTTPSEWAERMGLKAMPELDDLMAGIMGMDDGGTEVIYCEDCTVRGGDFMLDTVYGDEDAAPESGFCNLCEPQRKVPLTELALHLRVEHDFDMEAEMERWPDGSPVIVDETLTPGDFS